MASRWARRLEALDRWFDAHDEVITVQQCDRLGFGVTDRRRLVSEGRIRRVHPRVLVRGRTPPGSATSLRVAVVAAGQDAAASHLSAAWWLGLTDKAPARHHLTVPPRRRVRLPGAVVHQATLVGEVRSVGGLRVTTPERTVIDLAARPEVPASTLGTAIERALSQGLTTDDRLVGRVLREGARRLSTSRATSGLTTEERPDDQPNSERPDQPARSGHSPRTPGSRRLPARHPLADRRPGPAG